jgi:hypothetical protein
MPNVTRFQELRQVDFIEKYFGITPHGGDGALEVMLLVLLVLVVVAIGMHLPIGGRTKNDDLKRKRRY